MLNADMLRSSRACEGVIEKTDHKAFCENERTKQMYVFDEPHIDKMLRPRGFRGE